MDKYKQMVRNIGIGYPMIIVNKQDDEVIDISKAEADGTITSLLEPEKKEE